MSLLSIFSGKKAKEKLEDNPHFKVRSSSYFLSDTHYQHYIRNGWVVIPHVVSAEEISAFASTLEEISKLDGFELDEQFLNSGCLLNPVIRSKTQDTVKRLAPAILGRIFDMDVVEAHTGGTYQVKPCSERSDLQIHQDSAVVDEDEDYCLFCWIPFQDITEQNGPLWVLSGSHLWGNTQRSFTMPWNLLEQEALLRPHMHPLTVNKGDMVIFDPALIHSSSANLSEEVRKAVTITAIRKGYQLVYFYRDEDNAPGQVDKYLVDETFFHDYDFHIGPRPDDHVWKKETVAYVPFQKTRKEVLALIKQYQPKG
jgi:hypothetical protein